VTFHFVFFRVFCKIAPWNKIVDIFYNLMVKMSLLLLYVLRRLNNNEKTEWLLFCGTPCSYCLYWAWYVFLNYSTDEQLIDPITLWWPLQFMGFLFWHGAVGTDPLWTNLLKHTWLNRYLKSELRVENSICW
jgi:hypothetical protein